MLIKRHYDHEAPKERWVKRRGANGAVREVPPLKGVELKSELKPRAHFTPDFVRAGQKAGFITISGNVMLLTTVNAGTIRYRVEREPGYYCCHCGAELEDAGQVHEDGKTGGQHHVADEHSGAPSPDRNNPAGYERINFYDCVKE